MDIAFDQSEHWSALVRVLQLGENKNANKPILWIGAGLSVPAGLPTTGALIEQLNQAAPQELPPFTPNDTTLAAQSPQRSFSHWMELYAEQNRLGTLTANLAKIFLNADSRPTSSHQQLIKLPIEAIVTTNYDKLLESALDSARVPFQVIKQQQNLGLEQADLLPLYKIHGCIDDIKNWTLTDNSYQRFNHQSSELSSLLLGFMRNNSMIFLGCAMLDPRIIELYQSLEKGQQLDNIQTHFVIMPRDEWQQIPADIKACYQRAKIKPILFQQFSQLPGLLEKLNLDMAKPLDQHRNQLLESSDQQRLKREQEQLTELLYEQLAPQLISSIADIWFEVKQGENYQDKLKRELGIPVARKAGPAFAYLEEPLVELCELLVADNVDFASAKTRYSDLTAVFEASQLNVERYDAADNSPKALLAIIKTLAGAKVYPDLKPALSKLCEVVIDGVAALPRWTKDNLLSQLKNSEVLFARFVEEIERLKRDMYNETDVVNKHEGSFRRTVAREFDQLQIYGIDFGMRVRKYQLRVAYISLTVENEHHGESNASVMSTGQALIGFERLVILGEAGQGKTTLLQWLTVNCVRREFSAEQAQWNDKIPLLIKLREVINRPQLPQLADFYPLMDSETEFTQEHQNWLATVVKNRQAILMIDGFDEVPIERRAEVLAWLSDLCETYAGNQFILTSRPNAYDEGCLQKLNFVEVNLKPMDMAAQQDFIAHWHHAVALEIDETQPQALAPKGVELYDKLSEQPALRSLAQNPLLCGVICMLHYHRNGYLPQNKTELYEATSRMFLDSRERQKQVVEEDSFAHLDLQYKVRFLAFIAHWMTKGEQTTIDLTRFEQLLSEKLANMPQLKEHISVAQLSRFFTERSGMLLAVGADELQFAHRSFQEYFCAWHMVKIENNLRSLTDNAVDDFWHGTIIQAVGLTEAQQVQELFLSAVIDCAKSASSDEHSTTKLYLLVLNCQASLREMSKAFSARLSGILATIIPPDNASIRDALTAAGELALPYLARPGVEQCKRTVKHDHYCAVALINMHTVDAYRLLLPYLMDKRSSYIEKIERELDKLDPVIGQQAQLSQMMLKLGVDNFDLGIARMIAFICQDGELLLATLSRTIDEDEMVIILEREARYGLSPLKSLASLTQLTHLDLSANEITELSSLANLTQLTHLDLSCNEITELSSLANLTQLTSLNLLGNKITELSSLANLTQLTHLDLGWNKITDISSLANLTQLTRLDLSCNEITELSSLANLTQLTHLDLSGNEITDISSLANLTQLTRLDLAGNEITAISSLANLTQLTHLDFHGNKIENFEVLSGLTQLEQLHASEMNKSQRQQIQIHLPGSFEWDGYYFTRIAE